MKTKLLTNLIAALTVLIFPASAFAASLSLSPTSGTFNKGCSFSLQINLNTSGVATDGTDAIVQYDQSKITATSISSGTIYSDYPGNSVDDSTGKATVSGLASVSSPYSGSGVLATVNFKVLDNAPAGATQLQFAFDSNDKTKTTDSNVVERGTVADVLSSVVDGNYTVGTGTACVSGGGTTGGGTSGGGRGATGSGTLQPTPASTLPPAGTAEFTYTLAIIGSILTILGILGLALL